MAKKQRSTNRMFWGSGNRREWYLMLRSFSVVRSSREVMRLDILVLLERVGSSGVAKLQVKKLNC
jgi:hypothetical protein